MKNSAAALTLAGALCVHAYDGRAQQPAGWKDFQELMNSAEHGYNAMDGVGFVNTTMPETTLRYADGSTMNIAEWRKRTAASFEATAGVRAALKLLEVEVEIPRATITYAATVQYRLKADMQYRYQSSSRWTAMLVKTPDKWCNGWRVKQFMQLSEEVTCDGKPVPQGVPVPRW